MDVQIAIRNRRSIRRFQSRAVPDSVLLELVELSRLYASGGNSQPVRYAVVSRQPLVDEVFSMLAWAMYLPDFVIGPHQRPPAYIVLLRDNRVKRSCQFEVGAAATTLMLAAEAHGLSTCCLGSFPPGRLSQVLSLEVCYVPELVIAVGYADQASTAVPYADTVRYRQNPDGSLSVPKRSLEDVLIYYEEAEK